MPATSIFDLANRLLEGRLGEKLLSWRREGLSFNAIARRLHDEHDIDVTDETARRWVREIEATDMQDGPAGTGPSSRGDLEAAVRATA